MTQKTPGVGFFGKIRIPTIGHASAIEHAKKIAAKKNAQLHIGLSGTSHPLTPETKREHAEKLFNHPVMPASKHTSSVVSFLSHMNKHHDDFTLVAGQDRADEYHRIISKYNGKPDSQGNVPFHFKKWRVHGVTRNTAEVRKPPTAMSHDELTKTVSASKLEALANKGNYEHFAAYHPGIPRSHVRKLYNQIRMGSKLTESTISEAPLEMDNYDKKAHELKPRHIQVRKIPKKRNRLSVRQNNDRFPSTSEYTHLSSTPTHHIFRHTEKNELDDDDNLRKIPHTEPRESKFLAIDRKTKKTHMYVKGYYTPSSKKLKINMLKGHPQSTIKAHDFYHHLLVAGHVKELHSDATQSSGGRKVWKKLSHLPHVKMHTSDTHEPIKNDQDLDSHYTHDKDFDRITARHSAPISGSRFGRTNYAARNQDPEWKDIYKKVNRSIVARAPLKENIGQTLSRDLMPQIKKQHVSGFLNHLKNQGITHTKKTVDSNTLKSSQSEFDREKIASLVHAKNKDRIITSNDDHVMDGHHRWLANKHTDQDTKTYKIDLPILELLRQAREYVGGLQESTKTHTFDDILDAFTSFAGPKLGITKLPPVIRDISIQGSFGGYVPSEKCIRLATKDRHPLDVLRTLAHELVHHKQNEDGKLTNPAEDGKTGSDIENEANAMAGQIMRHWAKANPNHFELQSLTENIAIFVVGVPCSGKDQIIKSIQESFQEIDIQALQKTNLTNKILVTASAEKLNNLSEAICYLDDLGYHTSMIYVNVDNETSKLRNEQRGQRGQRMLKEMTRQVKYDLSTQNRETLQQLFSEDFALVDNTPELKSKPKDREWGTKSLTKIYKNMTPGQAKKRPSATNPNTDMGNDGIGATTGTASTGGLGMGFSVPIYEWMTNPRTIERFTNRYGKDAQYRINEVAKMFEQNGLYKTPPKTLVNIRETYHSSKPKNNK